MNTLPAPHSSRASKHDLAKIAKLLREVLKRGYAVMLLLVIFWLSWETLYYLVSSLMLPARPPAQIVDISTT